GGPTWQHVFLQAAGTDAFIVCSSTVRYHPPRPRILEGVSMRRLMLAALLLGSAPLLAQQETYRITHTYTLGGDGAWDYVVPDPPMHRLFIARANRVMVVDAQNGGVIWQVTGIMGAHGIAVVADAGRGFA